MLGGRSGHPVHPVLHFGGHRHKNWTALRTPVNPGRRTVFKMRADLDRVATQHSPMCGRRGQGLNEGYFLGVLPSWPSFRLVCAHGVFRASSAELLTVPRLVLVIS